MDLAPGPGSTPASIKDKAVLVAGARRVYVASRRRPSAHVDRRVGHIELDVANRVDIERAGRGVDSIDLLLDRMRIAAED
jgi:hypothetical protein